MDSINTHLKHSLHTQSSIGMCLRYAREGLGLTQKEIAQRLCLHLTIIQALEDDNFEVLSEPVFVKGYIRNYATLVGLNVLELIEKYKVKIQPNYTKSSQAALPNYMIIGQILRNISNYLILVVLLLLLAIWWYERHEAFEEDISPLNISYHEVPFKRPMSNNQPLQLLPESEIEQNIMDVIIPFWHDHNR